VGGEGREGSRPCSGDGGDLDHEPTGCDEARGGGLPGGNGKIVFSSDRAASDGSADYEIYVINTDGRISTTQLTDNSSQLSDEDPTFSPDGSKIAYSSRFHRDIWVMNADGSGTPTQLTNDQVEDHSPAWSPDGEKIAFGSNRQGLDGSRDPDIFVMNADGSGTPTRLTNDAGWEPPNPTYDDYAPPSHPTAPR
jgi:Tol biopolymer transport system component